MPVRIVDLDDIERGEIAENTERKDFLPSEIDAIRRKHEATLKAAAKERMSAGGKGAKVSQPSRTMDKVGAFAGISGRTVEKIAAVVEAAEAEPDRFGKLLADMDRTGRVNGIFNRLKIARQVEAIRAEPSPLPGRGPYRVIVADPPWPYEISPRRSVASRHNLSAAITQSDYVNSGRLDCARQFHLVAVVHKLSRAPCL